MKKNITFLLFFLLLVITKTGFSQIWEPIGPQGANIVSIQSTSTAMFAASYTANVSSNLWRSGNNGVTWDNITGGFSNKKIKNLWTQQDTIIVSIACNNIGGIAQNDGGAFQSTDNGQTWTTLWTNTNFNEPDAFLKKGNIIFLGTLNGVFRSIDGGQNWTNHTGGVATLNQQVKCFETSGDTIFMGTRKGLYRSLDNCATWQLSASGLPTTTNGNWITKMTKIGGILYASTYQNGVYKSTNTGISWVAVNNGLTDLLVNTVYYNGTTLFAGTYNTGIFKSSDGGASWTVATQGLTSQGVNCFFQQENKLRACGEAGIFESTDNGGNWVEANNGINGHIIGTGGQTPTVIAKAGNYLFSCSYQGRIFRSADDGANWQPVGTTIRIARAGLGYFKTIAGNNNIVLASAYPNKLYKSTDWGENWTLIAFPEGGSPDEMMTVNNKIYGTLYNNIYYTEDDGLTWVQMVIPEMMNRMTKMGHDIYVNGGFDGAAQHYHQIYRAVNGTSTFTYMGDILAYGGAINALGSQNNTLFAAAYSNETGIGEGIYKSADNGATWTFDGLAGIKITGFASEGNYLFARSKWDFYVRNNVENTWININLNIPIDLQCAYSSALLVNNGKLFASGATKSLYMAEVSQFDPPVQPGIISGSAAPCIGSTQTYSVTNVPGVTYTWQPPVGWTILSGQNTNSISVLVGSVPGTVIVTPSNAYGSGPYQYVVVMPNSNPPNQPGVITGAINPLEGTSQSYSVMNDPGVSYTWAFPSGWVQTAGGNTNSVSVLVGSAAGNIQVTPSTPCGTGTPRTLVVSPIPSILTISTVTIASGQSNCYNATGTIYVAGSGSTFTIENGGSATMIAGQNIIYSPETKVFEGGYMHGYISTEFCTNPSSPVAGNPIQTDVVQSISQMVVNSSIRIYPNPAANQFTLELLGAETTEMQKLEIYSLSGMKVIEQDCSGNSKQTVSVVDLAPGVYVVKVMAGSERITLKLVKM